MSEMKNASTTNSKLAQNLYLSYLFPQMIKVCKDSLLNNPAVGLPSKELRYIQNLNQAVLTLSDLANSDVIDLFNDLRLIEAELSKPYNNFIKDLKTLGEYLPHIKPRIGKRINISKASVRSKKLISSIRTSFQTIERNLEDKKLRTYPEKIHEINAKINEISKKTQEDLNYITMDIKEKYPNFRTYLTELDKLQKIKSDSFNDAIFSTISTVGLTALGVGALTIGTLMFFGVITVTAGIASPIAGFFAGGIGATGLALLNGTSAYSKWIKYNEASTNLQNFASDEKNNPFKIHMIFYSWLSNLSTISVGLDESQDTLLELTKDINDDIKTTKPYIDIAFNVLHSSSITQKQKDKLIECTENISIENTLIESLKFLLDFNASSIGCLSFEVVNN